MKKEVIASDLLNVPSSAALYHKAHAVILANPLHCYPTSSSVGDVPVLSLQSNIDCLRLSRDERNLVVSCGGIIKFMDLNNGREIRNLIGHNLAVKSLCPSRTSIYSWFSGSLDSSWTMWDIRQHPANVITCRTTGLVRVVECSPDDRLLAVGTDAALQLYDLRNRLCLKQFNVSTTGVIFHPSQRLMTSYGLDRVLRFWCPDQLECVSVSDVFDEDIKATVFSAPSVDPDDDFIVAATDHELRILTWEPCETLSSVPIDGCERSGATLLNMSLSNDGHHFNMICAYGDRSASMVTSSVEEIIRGGDPFEPESESEDMTVMTLDSQSTTPSPTPSDEVNGSVTSGSDMDMGKLSTRPPHAPVANGSGVRTTPSIILPREPTKSTARRPDSLGAHPRPQRAVSCSSFGKQITPNGTKARIDTRPRSPSETSVSFTVEPVKKTLSNSRMSLQADAQNPKRSSKTPSTVVARRPSPARDDVTKPPRGTPPVAMKKLGMTAEMLLKKTERGHHNYMVQSEKRILSAQQLETKRHSGGLPIMAKEALNFDSSCAHIVMKKINEGRRWELGLVHLYMSVIKEHLLEKRSAYRREAIEALSQISTGMVDRLKSCARAQSTIGVDVAAEERKVKALACIKELKELCDNREQYYRKMAEDTDVFKMDALMVILKTL